MSKIQDVDNDDLLILAAKGNRQAQSLLGQRAMALTHAGELPYAYGIFFAEIFCRMAAAHGQREDKVRLPFALFYSADLLAKMGCENESRLVHAESLQVIECLADDGEEGFATAMNMVVADADAEVLRLAALMSRDGLPVGWRPVPQLTEDGDDEPPATETEE